VVTLYTRIRGFPQSLDANTGIVRRAGHDHFFPNPSQFLHYRPSYVLDTEVIAV
jgi:hypothetical protein